MRRGQAWLLCLLLMVAAAASAADQPGSKQDHAAKLKYDGDSYEGKDENEGYGYEKPYGCDDDDCPNPQVADSVRNGYLAHYTFSWAALAQELADGKAPARRKGRPQVIPRRQHAKTSPADEQLQPNKIHRPGAASNKTAAAPNQPASGAVPPQSKQAAAASAAGKPRGDMLASLLSDTDKQTATNKPAGATANTVNAAKQPSGAPRGSTVVRPAAVTNPKYLLPTSEHEHQRGFLGSNNDYVPADEALAVAQHPHEDAVVVLHAVNSNARIFVANKDGDNLSSDVPTTISLDQVTEKMGLNVFGFDPSAFFDRLEQRFVLVWATGLNEETDYFAPVVVCVSATNNPLGTWTAWALSSVPYSGYCSIADYFGDYPQASYSSSALSISIGGFCGNDYQSAVHIFPKSVLFETPTAGAEEFIVPCATYLPNRSWFRSLPTKDQARRYSPSETNNIELFNNWVLPSRPQSTEDIHESVFVQRLPNSPFLSIAKLTNEGALDSMHSILTAPKIYAAVVEQGVNFANTPSYPDGNNYIPQPGNVVNPLDSGDTGLVGGRSYGATHYKGQLYVTNSEFFGEGNTRTPALYWGIIQLSHKLCKAPLLDYGVVASADLALGYPMITARPEGGAVLAYAYGGAGDIRVDGNSYPAYAGVATTVVGCSDIDPRITIVKRGDTLVNVFANMLPQRWGDYSAVDWLDASCAWFVVPVALSGNDGYESWIFPQQL